MHSPSGMQAREIGSPARMGEIGWGVLVLAFTAGFVDAVGYIVLFQVFTAHMSGNSVAMCVQFSLHDWEEFFRRGFPIPMFLLGTAAGAFFNQGLPRLGLRSTFALVFGIEALLLLLFILVGQPLIRPEKSRPNSTAAIMPPSPCFPSRSACRIPAVRHVAGGTVHTTYVSGLLTSITGEIVGLFFRRYDRTRGTIAPAPARPSPLGRVALMSSVYLSFLTGAVLGGTTLLAWALAALLIPIGCLAGLIVFDLRHPNFETTAWKPSGT